MRKVGPTLAGCVLNHPGNADPQFFRHISCPNQLTDGPGADRDGSHEIFMVASIQEVHRSPSSPLWACLLFTVLARFCQMFVRGVGWTTSWRRSGPFKEIDCDAMSLRRD